MSGYELEDGSGVVLLEGGDGILLLEDSEPSAVEYQRIYGLQIRLGDDGVETVDRLIVSPDGQ